MSRNFIKQINTQDLKKYHHILLRLCLCLVLTLNSHKGASDQISSTEGFMKLVGRFVLFSSVNA